MDLFSLIYFEYLFSLKLKTGKRVMEAYMQRTQLPQNNEENCQD